MAPPRLHAYGVFKPVGHMVVSFASAAQAEQGHAKLTQLGFREDHIRQYTDREMLSQTNTDIQHASPLAAVGQELNLIKSHRALAERGYHWLVVHVDSDEQARAMAAALKDAGAERAQLYGRFVIEELISHPGDLPQVAESPDRGLDAQTPSGLEEERAILRPATPTGDGGTVP